MTEDDGLAFAPILVIDLRAVAGCDRRHGIILGLGLRGLVSRNRLYACGFRDQSGDAESSSASIKASRREILWDVVKMLMTSLLSSDGIDIVCSLTYDFVMI